jgi:hypothetical protein
MIKILPEKEIGPEKLVRFCRSGRTFYLCAAGERPELGPCFFYADDNYQFFFYTQVIDRGGGLFDFEIGEARLTRLENVLPRMRATDLPAVEENVRQVLSERHFGLPERPIRAGDEPHAIIFRWRFANERIVPSG